MRRRCRRGWARGHGPACRLPSLQAAIQHRDGIVAQPFQHPPQAPDIVPFVAVVHHDLLAVVDAHLAEPTRHDFALRQGVTTAIDSLLCLVGAQVTVQVGMLGTGNVPRFKQSVGRLGLHQVKAAIQNGTGRALLLQVLQFGRAN